MSVTVIVILSVIIALALFLPFTVHKVEENLEAFLFVLGIGAVTTTGLWSWHLGQEMFKEPIAISLAVLVVGLLFRKFRHHIVKGIERLEKEIGVKKTIIVLVFALSLLSSVITAIIAALVLCEIVSSLRLSRRDTVHVIVMGCFGIGLGAVLTPVGEPLSTIVTSKLNGEPHNANFFYLLKLLWMYVLPGVAVFSVIAGRVKDPQNANARSLSQESSKDIVVRAAKVFLFVMALVLFGKGLTPLAEISIAKLPNWALYWVNSLSAILDNATMAAAEIVPTMSKEKIIFLLMSLIVSGGLLIPGNIPNIICASKFKIKSKEWAKDALPIGIVAMFMYFIILSVLFR